MAGIGKYKGEGNFEMGGYGSKTGTTLYKKEDKILKESNKKLIEEQRQKFKSGEITRQEFRDAKKEIKGYTDVDVAREHISPTVDEKKLKKGAGFKAKRSEQMA